jgi:protease IV
MRNHPLRVGLLLFAAVAMVFFIAVFFSASMDGAGLLGDRIGLVRIEGVITDSRSVIEELEGYRDSRSIKAILVRIDSPGGGVVPSQEIYEEVKKIRDEGKKTVVVSMGSVAASGGYYIASASDRIVANPGTITGSIGVIMELANVQGLLEKIGVQSLVIKSGAHKDLGSPFRKMSGEEQALLQSVLDDIHDQFIQAVSDGRRLPGDEVRQLADGRIFTGRKAIEFGLVDELGNLQDAIRLAADIAGIEGEPTVVEIEKGGSWLDLIRSRWMGRLSELEIPRPGISVKYLMAF